MLKNANTVILNVDDYEPARYATSRILRGAGFEVLEAATGAETLRLVAEQPDLVILDVNLPDMHGFEVCRRIKADPHTARIPVLHLSASYRGSEARVKGLEGGADGYLTTPVEPEELVASVKALLRLRQVEREVQESEERFRSLTTAFAQVVWTTDAKGDVIADLPQWRALTGQAEDEIKGDGWLNAVHPEDRKRTATAWKHAIETRSPYRIEFRLRMRDGSYRYFQGRGVSVPQSGGQVREWVGVCVDIHERKQTEMALRKHNERLQLLSDAASRLLLTEDPRKYIEHLYRRLSTALGLEVFLNYLVIENGEQLRLNAYDGLPTRLARTLEHLDFDNPICGCATRERKAYVIEDVQASSNPRAELLRSLGLAAYTCHPLVANNHLIGTLSFGTRTRARFTKDELALLQTISDQIAAAVERTRLLAELRQQATALTEANQAKADFLAVMSHELRTPLNAILGFTDLLELGVAGPVTEKQREQLGRITASSRHLLHLIEGILGFARLEAGRVEVQTEPVELTQLMWEAAALIEPLVQKKGLHLRLTVPEAPLILDTDAGKVRQIVLNLLSNAVKFTRQGEVELEVHTSESGVVLRVRDTGIGIPPDELERIFDPFAQVEQSRSQRADGTGLGLSVTRQLARLLGGEVSVESEPGTGSTFTVRLSPQAHVDSPIGAAETPVTV